MWISLYNLTLLRRKNIAQNDCRIVALYDNAAAADSTDGYNDRRLTGWRHYNQAQSRCYYAWHHLVLLHRRDSPCIHNRQ